MHAFIEFSGKQFRVEEGASIKVPRLKEKIGTKISVENILLLEDGKKTTIGKPFIKGKKINGEIISHGRGRKVVVFKFKRRKGYQVKNTHRDEYTILKINKLGVQKKEATAKKKDVTDKKKLDINNETSKKVATKRKATKSEIKEKE
tara:strand:- start:126 stop:566 length:441 start_codon:yes stop_codon:yes gene_type:complete